ncbi:hypothetical protein [Taibaiella soli]|nr:hypothetical protein [Taibaiella soli]
MKKAILLFLAAILLFTIARAGIVQNILVVNKITSCNVVSKKVTSATIPFSIASGWIVAEVGVQVGNSKPEKKKFIFDTGASASFTSDFAAGKNWKTESVSVKQVALGEKGKQKEMLMTADPVVFSFGDIQVKQKHVSIDNMEVSSFKCLDAGGLIGSNILSKFVVTIDFINSTLTLTQKDAYDYSSQEKYSSKLSFMALPFQQNPYCAIKVNGEEYSGIFDTGFTGNVMLDVDSTKEQFRKITGKPDVLTYEAYAAMANVNGVIKKHSVVYEWDNANFKSEKDSFRADNITIQPASKNSCNVGLKFARQYEKVVIDWNKKDIYFFNPLPKPAPTHTEVCIRHLTDEQKFVIGLIETKSSFYANGLRSADEVVKIDDAPLSTLSLSECDLPKKLNELLDAANTIVVKRNGQEVAIAK